AVRLRAEALRARALAGEDFAQLAREFSGDGATRAAGGRIEGRFRAQDWPTAASAAVLALAPGQVSAVLDVERGFAFFEVLAAQSVPFEAVAAELRRELESERPAQGDLAAVRNVLVQRARIVSNPGVYGK
ncbi:MAG: hypothetical protein FJ298_04420, partial [Planctomycetes bacterium]|nr:hypothetical protein [Planctomycetota bacterium]